MFTFDVAGKVALVIRSLRAARALLAVLESPNPPVHLVLVSDVLWLPEQCR